MPGLTLCPWPVYPRFYFRTYFSIIFGPTSAPKMFPWASAATPSAPLVADASGVRLRVGDEGGDLAVARAPDADAALPARVALGVGLGIGAVEHVVLVDVDAAQTAELLPLLEELPVLVEDLQAVVGAVGDEQPALRVESDRRAGR